MDFVVIESPHRGEGESFGDLEANKGYARDCLRNSLLRGEAPFASHLLYTEVLDDDKPAEREAGLIAARAVIPRADRLCVYIDRRISEGMREAIATAKAAGVRIVYRSLKRPNEDLRVGVDAYAEEATIKENEHAGNGQVPECDVIRLHKDHD